METPAAAASAVLALLFLSAVVGASEGPLDSQKLQRRQDFYADYDDEGYVGALLEEDAGEGDGILYAAFAYDVPDDEEAAAIPPVYDYGDADYEGSEKKENKEAQEVKKIEKRNDKMAAPKEANTAAPAATGDKAKAGSR